MSERRDLATENGTISREGCSLLFVFDVNRSRTHSLPFLVMQRGGSNARGGRGIHSSACLSTCRKLSADLSITSALTELSLFCWRAS